MVGQGTGETRTFTVLESSIQDVSLLG